MDAGDTVGPSGDTVGPSGDRQNSLILCLGFCRPAASLPSSSSSSSFCETQPPGNHGNSHDAALRSQQFLTQRLPLLAESTQHRKLTSSCRQVAARTRTGSDWIQNRFWVRLINLAKFPFRSRSFHPSLPDWMESPQTVKSLECPGISWRIRSACFPC